MTRILAVCGVLLWSSMLVAQDIHYTQFFNSPLTLNPALTGFTRGGYRVGAAYRNQWFGAGNTSFLHSTYSTPSVFFDMPIEVNNDAVGIGGLFISDQAGGKALSSFTGCGSFSYIKALGKRNRHQLALGVQLGYTNKRLNASNLTFSTQFIGATFEPSLSNGESFSSFSVHLFNLNSGVLWLGKFNQRVSMYAGGSVFNVVQPQENFLQHSKSPWFLRWNIHTGVDVTLGRLIHVLPSVMYMMQTSANELLPGLSVAYDVTPVATVSLGSMVRVNDFFSRAAQADAVALYGSFDYKGFKLGVSYDFTVSSFRKVKPGLGALEITAIYIGKKKNNKSIIFCPMF
ncbi:MAG: PorP/SprF family type IX secretion system membrane protein [Chitinophagales bacterium]|nr:PorP/SprF family type IX secretion system membrane protein [Chitinophagales bacterium]